MQKMSAKKRIYRIRKGKGRKSSKENRNGNWNENWKGKDSGDWNLKNNNPKDNEKWNSKSNGNWHQQNNNGNKNEEDKWTQKYAELVKNHISSYAAPGISFLDNLQLRVFQKLSKLKFFSYEFCFNDGR